METKQFRVTITLNFDEVATSIEAMREIANERAIEWLHEGVTDIRPDEITIKELTN